LYGFSGMEQSYAPDYPLEKLLQERFHITTGFHPGQREIIEHLTQGKRVLAIQRTGWGKSQEICTII
jgi:superfamily II DNA helicase RecQ